MTSLQQQRRADLDVGGGREAGSLAQDKGKWIDGL